VGRALFDAAVDLNSHQIEAAMFARFSFSLQSRKEWDPELQEKLHIPALVLDSKVLRLARRDGGRQQARTDRRCH
jgi:hypothetical protein